MQIVVGNILSMVIKLEYLLDSMMEKIAFSTGCESWIHKAPDAGAGRAARRAGRVRRVLDRR
jgi:hypothetical protein